MVFFDNCPKHPSIYLNNILHALNSKTYESKTQGVLLIKDRVSKGAESLNGLANSYYCEVVIGVE